MQARKYKIHLKRPEDIRRLLSGIVNEVRTDKIATDKARTIATCCNTLLKIFEANDFEARLARLEAALYESKTEN